MQAIPALVRHGDRGCIGFQGAGGLLQEDTGDFVFRERTRECRSERLETFGAPPRFALPFEQVGAIERRRDLATHRLDEPPLLRVHRAAGR